MNIKEGSGSKVRNLPYAKAYWDEMVIDILKNSKNYLYIETEGGDSDNFFNRENFALLLKEKFNYQQDFEFKGSFNIIPNKLRDLKNKYPQIKLMNRDTQKVECVISENFSMFKDDKNNRIVFIKKGRMEKILIILRALFRSFYQKFL